MVIGKMCSPYKCTVISRDSVLDQVEEEEEEDPR